MQSLGKHLRKEVELTTQQSVGWLISEDTPGLKRSWITGG